MSDNRRETQRKRKYQHVAKIIKENKGKWFTNKKAITLLPKQQSIRDSFSVQRMDRWLKTFRLKQKKIKGLMEYYFEVNQKVKKYLKNSG